MFSVALKLAFGTPQPARVALNVPLTTPAVMRPESFVTLPLVIRREKAPLRLARQPIFGGSAFP